MEKMKGYAESFPPQLWAGVASADHECRPGRAGGAAPVPRQRPGVPTEAGAAEPLVPAVPESPA